MADSSTPTWLDRTQAVEKVPNLSPRDFAVLLALAYFAGDSWPRCWPAVETVCAFTRYGRTAVINATNALDARGLIAKRRRRDVSDEYTMLIPGLPVSTARGLTVGTGDGLCKVRETDINQEVEPGRGGVVEQGDQPGSLPNPPRRTHARARDPEIEEWLQDYGQSDEC